MAGLAVQRFMLDVSGSMASQEKFRDALEALEASIAEARLPPTLIDSASRRSALELLKGIAPG